MPKYWKKEVPGECWLPDGRKITVDFVGADGDGWIASDVGYINHQIGLAVQQGVGGWVAATEAEYEAAVKKKANAPESSKRNSLFRANAPFNHNRNAGPAGRGSSIEVPVSPKADPIRVPTPDQMKPRRGPIPREVFI